jgi:chemotaxis signal transduction protein
MEAIEKNEELASQNDAVKLYLDALLNNGVDIVPEELTPTELLSNAILEEIKNSKEQIKRPRWATEYFSCLPITIAGISLLIPLRQVRTVISMREEVVPIEEMPEWIMGSITNSHRQIKVIDTEKIVYQNEEFPEQVEPASQLVLINDGKWGLTCDAVGKMQQLSQSDLTWRAKTTSRRWIAGVSNKHKLPVIDIKRIEFALALESQLV